MANRYPVRLAPFTRADRLILADDERVVDFVLIDALRLIREGRPSKAVDRLSDQANHRAGLAFELQELLQFVVDPTTLAPEISLEIAQQTPDNVLTYLQELRDRPEAEPIPDNAVVLGVEPHHDLRIRQKEGQPSVQHVTRGALRDVVGILYHTDDIGRTATALNSTTAGLSRQKLVNIANALCRMVRPAMATAPLGVKWDDTVLRLVRDLWHEVQTGTLTTVLDYDGEDFRGSRGECQWALAPNDIREALRMLRRLEIVPAIKHLRTVSCIGLKEAKDTCDLLRSVRPEVTNFRSLDGRSPIGFLGSTRDEVAKLWDEVMAEPATLRDGDIEITRASDLLGEMLSVRTNKGRWALRQATTARTMTLLLESHPADASRAMRDDHNDHAGEIEMPLKVAIELCHLLRSVRADLAVREPKSTLGAGVLELVRDWWDGLRPGYPGMPEDPDPEPLPAPGAYLKDLFAEAAEIPTTPATHLVYRFEPNSAGLFCVEAEMSIDRDLIKDLVGILKKDWGAEQPFFVAYETLALREPWLPVGACRSLLEFLSDVGVGIQEPHYTAHSGAWSLVAGLCGKEA